jgi:hypothetical protein
MLVHVQIELTFSCMELSANSLELWLKTRLTLQHIAADPLSSYFIV